jgi:hypothetical protein
VLAVNIHPPENALVVPFMKGNGYDFLPLEGGDKWAEETYKVRGTPANFLIDAQGRVVFKPDARSPEAGRTLEREVEALLRRAGQ